jgi:N-acetylglutamate synthase-like GNAT family acetyltransferase
MRHRVLHVTGVSDSSSGVRYRPARPTDVPALQDLLERSDLPTAGVEQLLSGHADAFVVAETNDASPRVIGAAGVEGSGPAALLRSVVVDASLHGRGIGRELVERATERAISSGVTTLYLLTTTAAPYFSRLGYQPIERAAVPSAIASTHEFTTACPSTATVMVKSIRATLGSADASAIAR